MSAPVLHVIACAHGTHDAAGRVVIDGLRADLAALLDAEGPGAQVHEAYVDVQSPSLDEVVAALPPGEPAVIVPLLLSLGHHVHHDIHHAAAARPGTIAAAPLAGAGDDVEPRLVTVLAERVARAVPAGEAATSDVILAAAGTRAAEGQAEGHAVAGGLELAIWADLRVAATDAVLGVFCRRFGVPLIDLGSVRLPRLIGQSRAVDLILTGRPVSAEEAYAIGLANRLVGRGEALEAAIALAEQLAGFPQTCLRNDRASALEQWSLPWEAATANETDRGTATLRSGEARAGASRFAAGEGRGGRFG